MGASRGGSQPPPHGFLENIATRKKKGTYKILITKFKINFVSDIVFISIYRHTTLGLSIIRVSNGLIANL
jgi:hypothetical protein